MMAMTPKAMCSHRQPVAWKATNNSITPPMMNPKPKNTATAHTVSKLKDNTTQPKMIQSTPATR